jgi:hypothetical protein
MSTMSRLFAAFAWVAVFASGTALAVDPPAEAKLFQQQLPAQTRLCLLSSLRCSDMAQAPARFCRLGAAGCRRDGTIMQVSPLKAAKPTLSTPAK